MPGAEYAGKSPEEHMTHESTEEQPSATPPRKRGFFSARFMRSLSLGTKLWSTTVLMALPLIGLAGFYAHSLSSTLWLTAAEQHGYTLYQPLDQLAQRVVRREELEATGIARRVNVANQMRRLDEDVELRFAEFEQTDAEQGDAATHAITKDLRDEWTALKNAKPVTAQDTMAAHEHLLATIGTLSTRISTDWKLALDPEIVAYSLIDVSVNKLADARRFLIEARAHLAAMYNGAEYVPAEGAQVASLIALFGDRMTSARDEIKTAAAAALDRPALASQINEMGNDWDNGIATWAADVARDLATGHPAESDVRALLVTSAKYAQSLNSTQSSVLAQAGTALTLRYDSQLRNAIMALSFVLITVLSAVLLMYALSRRVAGAIGRLIFISERILENRFDSKIDESGADEISRLFARMNQLQQTMALANAAAQAGSVGPAAEAAAETAAEAPLSGQNERLSAALHSVSGCVMVADAGGTIVYTNSAVEEMLRNAEADIRKQLPGFSASAVVGANFDVFHRNPHEHSRLIASLTGPHTTQISVGGRKFRLILNPVNSQTGGRIGTVVEWADRTLELSLESEVNVVLAAVLDGDLSRRIDVAGKSGFFETLGQGMNRLVDNIQELITKVKATSRDVHSAAEELSAGNTNLSQRTEQQAASLEQTASSMEEITSTVKQNADNAHQANQLASAAREQAQAGGAVVNQAIAAMAGINESSKKIANIIGVIDEIAFQTNLLALNAAVEAARAGEQGRGFAVVASEVRSLAGRSAAAAKEIKELIRDSVGKVEGGTELVAQSGQTLEQIVTAVKKVTDVVAEIASASSEQIRGIEQVNNAITEMDGMTQQNAALVEQATAASQALTEQSGHLTTILSLYHTKVPGTRVGTAAGRPAPRSRAVG